MKKTVIKNAAAKVSAAILLAALMLGSTQPLVTAAAGITTGTAEAASTLADAQDGQDAKETEGGAEASEAAEETEADEQAAAAAQGSKSFELPDGADLVWAGTEYRLVNKLTHSFAPSGTDKVTVTYLGQQYPAYYWAPANQLILHMYNPSFSAPAYGELTEQEQEYWQGAYIEKDAAIEFETVEDYYAYTSCEQYLFVFDFDRNTIEPHVEFPTGTGYVVMVDYTEEQEYYLSALSKGFMNFGIFEFEVYQYLTVDDESYYYIVSGMNQDGDVYLYQYDFMKAEAGRVDPNMLIGLRYLDERTLALKETEDMVASYKDKTRKAAAIGIIALVVAAFVVINIFILKNRKKKNEDEDDYEENEYREAEEKLPVIQEPEEEKSVEEPRIQEPEQEEAAPVPVTDDSIILPQIELEPEAASEPEPQPVTDDSIILPKIELEPEAASESEPQPVTDDSIVLPKIELEPEAVLPTIELEPEAVLPTIELEPEAVLPKIVLEPEAADTEEDADDEDYEDDEELFYPGDTDYMKAQFTGTDSDDEYEDDEDDEDFEEEEDGEEDDDFYKEPRSRREKKEKPVKEPKAKEAPAKKDKKKKKASEDDDIIDFDNL